MSEIDGAKEYPALKAKRLTRNDIIQGNINMLDSGARECRRIGELASAEEKEIIAEILRAELSRQENAPLTWDELVSMTRKTVYIVDRTDDEKSGWSIVGKQHIKIGLEFITLCENLAFRRELKELYGQTWIAYRHEPKGEPNV